MEGTPTPANPNNELTGGRADTRQPPGDIHQPVFDLVHAVLRVPVSKQNYAWRNTCRTSEVVDELVREFKAIRAEHKRAVLADFVWHAWHMLEHSQDAREACVETQIHDTKLDKMSFHNGILR
jgi:hypothetical protein